MSKDVLLNRNSDRSLVVFSCAFFMWGLVTVLCNSLVSFYQNYFQLSYSTVMLLLMAFFVSRVIVSLPTSMCMERLGYRATLRFSLLWCALGCGVLALFVIGDSFMLLLLGVFVMATGITALQVVCSPYVSLSALPEKSTQRQSVATASNSIGTIIAPTFLMLTTLLITHLGIGKETAHISVLFVGIACAFIFLYRYYSTLDIPDIRPQKQKGFWLGLRRLLQNQKFVYLMIVIALYIGGEVIFGTLTISYLADPSLSAMSLNKATQLITLYWAGMFIGRLGLASYGHRFDTGRLFVGCSCVVVAISAIAVVWQHFIVGYLLLSVGIFNSTMYPVIYSKALIYAGSYRSQAAALLIMCSVGGAVLPMLQGIVIDRVGISWSYMVPCIIYVMMLILYKRSQALAWPR